MVHLDCIVVLLVIRSGIRLGMLLLCVPGMRGWIGGCYCLLSFGVGGRRGRLGGLLFRSMVLSWCIFEFVSFCLLLLSRAFIGFRFIFLVVELRHPSARGSPCVTS